jgi:O2-independent ubiquinone biosynthesis accessory factor UbiT
MPLERSPTRRLSRLRGLIDQLDSAMLWLFATRRGLVLQTMRAKQQAGLPLRDPQREARVQQRARRLARRLALPDPSAAALSALLIEDACRLQGLSGDSTDVLPPAAPRSMPMTPTKLPIALATRHDDGQPGLRSRLLRLLPPPRRLAPLARRVPSGLHCRLLDAVLRHTLSDAVRQGTLEPLHGRRVGISVDDLGIGWVLTPSAATIAIGADLAEAESVVHGSLTDLLLLASRLEDADTLFFHRRLKLTGDIELGLTARNLLDQLPWEAVPLAARIVLHRVARFAREARECSRAG